MLKELFPERLKDASKLYVFLQLLQMRSEYLFT